MKDGYQGMKKVLLYLPYDSDFYKGLYEQIKRGFEQVGWHMEGGCGYLEGPLLIRKIESFKPDFIFEMNRTKSELNIACLGIPHVCWLVDYWGRTAGQIKGSDILYLFSHAWLTEYKDYDGLIDVLYPGTDIDLYATCRGERSNRAILFLGHLPKIWEEAELNRRIYLSGNRVVQFKQVVDLVHHFSINPVDYQKNAISTKAFLRNQLKTQYLDTYGDQALFYDIFTRAFREGRRVGVMSQLVKHFDEVQIYGSENWLQREIFAHFYKGFLHTPQAMSKVLNQACFLLHDGAMPHFRTFDGMAAGCMVLKPDVSDYGIFDEWKNLGFTEGLEVYTYRLSEESISEMCAYIKKLSLSQLKDISVSNKEKMIACHSWAHRALKIIKDVQSL